MPLDPRLEPIRAALLTAVIDRTGTPAERRAAIVARRPATAGLMSSAGPDIADVRDDVVPASHGGVPVRIYRPAPGVLPGLLLIHGGGWWQGGLDDMDAPARKRAVAAECVVVSVDYRLAPEHPYPAALDDCWEALGWTVAHAGELGIDPARIAIGGGSAGGNLAAALSLRARDAGGPALVAQVLEVPATDLTLGSASIDEVGPGYLLDRPDLEECVAFYLAGGGDAKDPLVSPIFGQLDGLPRALITTCEMDPVRDDGERYAAALAAAGVPVTLRRFLGLGHGCGDLDVLLPEIAADYLDEVGRFLRDAFRAR